MQTGFAFVCLRFAFEQIGFAFVCRSRVSRENGTKNGIQSYYIHQIRLPKPLTTDSSLLFITCSDCQNPFSYSRYKIYIFKVSKKCYIKVLYEPKFMVRQIKQNSLHQLTSLGHRKFLHLVLLGLYVRNTVSEALC